MTEQSAPQAPAQLDRETTTASDMFDDLVGIEEIAVARVFGQSINDLSSNATQFLRALIFVDLRRGGSKDKDAFATAQAMKLGEVRSYFKEEETEAGGDDEGKGQ